MRNTLRISSRHRSLTLTEKNARSRVNQWSYPPTSTH